MHDYYCRSAFWNATQTVEDSITMLGMMAKALCSIMIGMMLLQDCNAGIQRQTVEAFITMLGMVANVMYTIMLTMVVTVGLHCWNVTQLVKIPFPWYA